MDKQSFALRAETLGKQYKLGQITSLDDGIRETLSNGMQVLARSLRGAATGAPLRQETKRELIWALRDVSFTIEPGTATGLIGRNGAGKSTLLKILSRITPPTVGEAWINGRIASLLEVGTGFQPDLTGRENVFLNGAILGMRRAEVRTHFAEIVAFAELERFIDTPVKRYSSGMFLRLAFSVAAHLNADILLMDEILAVGDLTFQRRCLEKMNEVTGNGRTVIFVSHKLGAVRRLCQRALYLDKGALLAEGKTEEVLSRYVRDTLDLDMHDHDSSAARFFRWQLQRNTEGDQHSCIAGDTVTFCVQLVLGVAIEQSSFQFALWGEDDEVVLSASSRDGGRQAMDLSAGTHELSITVRLPLRDGHYAVELGLLNQHGGDIERIELPPRLIVLAQEDRILTRERRGIVDEVVEFKCQAMHDDQG